MQNKKNKSASQNVFLRFSPPLKAIYGGYLPFYGGILFFLICLILYGNWFYQEHREHTLDIINNRLVISASTLPEILGTDFFQRATTPDGISEKEDWENIQRLTRITERTDIAYLYTLVVKGENIYLTSSSASPDERKQHQEVRYWTLYMETEKQVRQAIAGKQPIYANYTDRWGDFRLVYIPYRGSDGTMHILAADVCYSTVEQLLAKKLPLALLNSILLVFAAIPMSFLVIFQLQKFNFLLGEKQKSLIESEERYRALFENHHTVMLVIDSLSGSIVNANPAAEDFYGWSKAELCQMTIMQLNMLSAEEVKREIKKATSRKIRHFNFKHRLKSGVIRDVEVFTGPIDQGNRALLYSFIFDVTERKAFENALRESEDRFRLIFEKAPAGIALVDKEYQLLAANSAYCELLGCSEEEVRALHLPDFTHPDDVEENMRLQKQLGQGKISDFSMEKRFIRKNGDIRWGELTACAIKNREGEVTGFLGHVVDITERKEMQEHLLQIRKMDAIGQLAGGVAHDFNNQLSGILGYAQILMDRVQTSDNKSYAQRIFDAAMRSADLTRKLLTFSRKGHLRKTKVDMHSVIQDMVGMLEHSIDKRICIEQKLQADSSIIQGDNSQLQNALLNIALNAKDAMPNGGELKISTQCLALQDSQNKQLPGISLKPGNYLEITIADSGCGISQNHLPHLFEPFYTTKETGKGTGMGLASVYGAVKSHQGEISIDSWPGRGTVVKIYLPLMTESVPIEEAKKIEAPLKTKSLRVLIVDDEELLRSLHTANLKSVGHHSLTAEDGPAAIDLYRTQWKSIDLVILDMMMPRMDGLETFRQLKTINPDIVAVLISGFSLQEQYQAIMSEGIRGILQKPFKKEELLQAIQQALELSTV